jgi:hypothetical protein
MGVEMTTETSVKQEQSPMHVEPHAEHHWLRKLIGEWTYEMEVTEPGKSPVIFTTGTETVWPVGDLWVVGQARGSTSEGDNVESVITLGYDPQRGHYVGTWIGSPMANLWVYEGSREGNVLTLNSEGPDLNEPGGLSNYRDIIEFVSDDHRTLTAHVQGRDGQWQVMGMTTHYHRKR